MASVNKVILIGNLGRDPEIRYLPEGGAVANVSIATTDTWKDKSGAKQERTEWHRVSFFGRLAEVVGEYLKKGAPIYVEGRLQTRKWQDKEGQDRYTTEIVAGEMKMLGSKPSGSPERTTGGSAGGSNAYKDAKDGKRQPAAAGASRTGGFEQMDDDIPFAPIGRGISGHAI